MIDTHCHLQVREFDEDRGAVIQRAQEAGVEAFVVPAINEASFDATLAAARGNDAVFCGIGVHPHHASEMTEATRDRAETLVREKSVVAVGEIGLDYHYNFSPPAVQQRVFREQLRIAKHAGKPAIVHNRESDDDVLRIVEEEQDGSLRGVFHCFSSTCETLRRALALKFFVSFTGNIAFKNSTLGEVVRQAPLESVLIETDSPWMSPPPWRGKRNEPARVARVAETIAMIKNIPLEEVVKQTTANAKRLFALSLCAASLALVPAARAAHADTAAPSAAANNEFYRQFGVAAGLGTSSVIGSSSTAESGLFCTDARIVYMPFRSFGLEADFSYFVDDKYGLVYRSLDTDIIDYYRTLTVSARFVLNPSNRVAVGILLGGGNIFFSPLPRSGFNIPCIGGALNVAVNLPYRWGMLTPYGEYRVEVEVGQYHSMITPVTFGVMYYFPKDFRY